jgi:hypothetical protein
MTADKFARSFRDGACRKGQLSPYEGRFLRAGSNGGQVQLMKRLIIGVLAGFVLANLVLLITGRRVLMHERRVDPGDHYTVTEYGDLGKSEQSSLVCRYWTGRSVTTNVVWFSPNNMMGRDQCPFVQAEREL